MNTIDDFVLERVIAELRFNGGYLYWDTCGKIWLEISKKFPELVSSEVTPEKARFRLGNSDIQLSFSHNRLGTHEDFPKNLQQFRSFTNDSTQIILELLQIKDISRLGNRYQYVLGIDDKDSITGLLMAKGLFKPSERTRELGQKISEPGVRFVLEKEDISITVRVGYLERNLDISVPKPIQIDKSMFIQKGISVDLDFFTTKTVDYGTLDIDAFIETHERSARKLIETLLI